MTGEKFFKDFGCKYERVTEDRPMKVIKTKDPHEAQRCRLAQYLGLPKKIAVSGSTFYGVVRSVREDAGPLWIVTFIPTERKNFPFRIERSQHSEER